MMTLVRGWNMHALLILLSPQAKERETRLILVKEGNLQIILIIIYDTKVLKTFFSHHAASLPSSCDNMSSRVC